MATKYWRPQVGFRPQIDSITIDVAPTAGDIGTFEIGNTSLSVTAQSGTTTASLYAAAVKNAINATDTTENLVANESRSAGGQQLPEFRDVIAEISPTNTAVVLVKSKFPGVPFYDFGGTTISESASGSTLAMTAASVQTATGQRHWNAAGNWLKDDGTFEVPANDDTVVFDQGSVGPSFGLPNGSLEVTVVAYQSFTGWIGLPQTNTANGIPYYEYRQRYVRLDDAGSGSDKAHRFGVGDVGTGSPLINIKQSTIKGSPIVFNTGRPLVAGTHALNICCTTNTSTIKILGGWVDYSSQDGSTSAYVDVSQTAGESRGITAVHTTSGIVNISGGKAVIGGAGAINTINVRGGVLKLERQTGAITNLSIYKGGTVLYPSTATIDSFYVDGGTFDARENAGGFTITGGTLNSNARYLDPYRRTTMTSPFSVLFEISPDLQFGAANSSGINIDNLV